MSEASSPSSSPRNRAPVVFAILGVILIVALGIGIYTIRHAKQADQMGGMPPGMEGMPPAAVYVQPVESEVAQEEAIVTGSLHAVNRANVAAREAGAVLEVKIDEGDLVQKGDVLVELDPRRLKAQMAEAEASATSAESMIRQREAEQKRAASDLEMKEGLLQDRAISESEVLDARRQQSVSDAQLASSRDAVTEARSRLELMQVRMEELTVRAPFTGVVTGRMVEIGEWVSPGQEVATVASVDPIEAWVRVPQRYLGDVQGAGDQVQVMVEGSGSATPEKMTIVPDVDRRSLLFTAIATIPNPESSMAAGQSVRAVLPVGTREDRLVIPVNALLRTRSGDFVFVVREAEGQPMPAAERVNVEVAFERNERVFLNPVEGLAKGDRIVVEGNERLMPGQPLMIRDRSGEGDGGMRE